DWLRYAGWIPGEHARTHFLLARLSRLQGRTDETRFHLQRAWDAGYPTAALEREQWLLLAQIGRLDQAEPHLWELANDPQIDGSVLGEAFVNGYLMTYQFDKALAMLAGWEADFPRDPRPHVLRAQIWEHLERWVDAEQEFRTALQLQ